MSNFWAAVVPVLSAILGAAGLRELISAIFKRKTVKVEVAERVNQMAMEWAAEVKADAEAARKEAREARREAREAREEATAAHQQTRMLRIESEAVAGRLRQLRNAILSPTATVEALRVMAGANDSDGV